jgi:hypothetical protein
MMDDLPVHPSSNPMLVGGRIGANGEQLYSNLYGKEMEMMRKMMNMDESEMQNHHQMMKYGQPMMGMPRNYPPNIPPGMLTDVEMKHLTTMGGGGSSRFSYPQPSMNFGYDNKMVGGNKFEGLLRPCYDMVRNNGGPRGFPMTQPYSSSPIPPFDSPATQIPNNNYICDPPHFGNNGNNINKNPNCGVVIKTENNLNCGGNIANNLISSDFHNNNNNTTGNNELITTNNNKCSDELFAKSTTTSSTNLLIANNNSHSNTNSINNSNMNNNNNNNNNSCTNNKNEPNTYNLNRNVNDNNSKNNKTTSLRNYHRGKCMDGEDEENSIGDTATADGCDDDRRSLAVLENDSNEEYTDL